MKETDSHKDIIYNIEVGIDQLLDELRTIQQRKSEYFDKTSVLCSLSISLIEAQEKWIQLQTRELNKKQDKKPEFKHKINL